MGLFRGAITATLLALLLGITAVNAQVNAELPQLKSGASVTIGVPVDFNVLNQRVGAIYEVMESDDSHIVWKFTGTTGDWAFVFADGRLVVASTVDLDLASRDTLADELGTILDMFNAVSAGSISTADREKTVNSIVYYASESGIYHRLMYSFNSNFDLTLVVPECEIKAARLWVPGDDSGGQKYLVDDNIVTGCIDQRIFGTCSAPIADVTQKIPTGTHKITALDINEQHTMTIDALTSPAKRKFVLHSKDFVIWINETSSSMTIDDMILLIAGNAINTTA